MAFTYIAGPNPVSYVSFSNCEAQGNGFYGPYERAGTLYMVGANGGAASPNWQAWSKPTANPSAAWTALALPPSNLIAFSADTISYWDGSKIWVIAHTNDPGGPYQVVYFDTIAGTWTAVGATIDSNQLSGGNVFFQPMADGTVLLFGQIFNAVLGNYQYGFFRLSGGTWSSFQIMHNQTGSAGSAWTGIASIAYDGTSSYMGVIYGDNDGVSHYPLYFRKVFSDDTTTAESLIIDSGVPSSATGIWQVGGSYDKFQAGDATGRTVYISGGRIFVQYIRKNTGSGHGETLGSLVSTTFDGSGANPTWSAIDAVVVNPTDPLGNVRIHTGQFALLGGTLTLLAIVEQFDSNSPQNITATEIYSNSWTGTGWTANGSQFDIQAQPPTIPAGLVCGPAGGNAFGAYSFFMSVAPLSTSGRLGLLTDFAFTDTPGNCANNENNAVYYYEVAFATPAATFLPQVFVVT